MDKVRSEDGTAIAFDRVGEGPPIVLVLGAFNDRATGAPLAAALQDRFSIVTYDRRGRGDSGDTPPYAVEREVEDLQAIIEEVDGSAAVFGYSSGAVLFLMAAVRANLEFPAYHVLEDARHAQGPHLG
jgi:pimeloyl-ACP methyl ester carboxylesterase